MATREHPNEIKPNELKLVRVYDAPVQAVWDAWTDPAQVAQWWGPRGFSLTTHAKDLRAGGHWTYTMHGPDGTDYPNETLYHEVVERRRLVYDHGSDGTRPPLFRVSVDFIELDRDTTRMEMTMRFPDAEAFATGSKAIKQHGGHSTWDRLAEYLADANGEDIFVINRSFDADIATVFEMWANPAHFAGWMGPAGSSMDILEADVREGGSLHYRISNADGLAMHGQAHYRRIRPHDLLVYTQNFSDEAGNLIKPPFAPTWPDAMLTTVTFAEEGPSRTRVTVLWSVFGDANDTERQTFHDAKPGMTVGWTGSFDKLEQALASN
jgi:uncharacterized protein YndB with AHSA1/START domain